MPIFDIAVRPGALLSEGSRHPTPAAAVLDLLDNPAEHGGMHLVLSAHVQTPLEGDFLVLQDDACGMTAEELQFCLLGRGGASALPVSSLQVVSHFSTGHLAALAALAVDIIIASSKNGRGTLVRWYVRVAH